MNKLDELKDLLEGGVPFGELNVGDVFTLHGGVSYRKTEDEIHRDKDTNAVSVATKVYSDPDKPYHTYMNVTDTTLVDYVEENKND